MVVPFIVCRGLFGGGRRTCQAAGATCPPGPYGTSVAAARPARDLLAVTELAGDHGAAFALTLRTVAAALAVTIPLVIDTYAAFTDAHIEGKLDPLIG